MSVQTDIEARTAKLAAILEESNAALESKEGQAVETLAELPAAIAGLPEATVETWPVEWNSTEVTSSTVKVDAGALESGLVLVKVSNLTATLEELARATVTANSVELPYLDYNEADIAVVGFYATADYSASQYIFSVSTAGTDISLGLTFPEPGLYAVDYDASGYGINVNFSIELTASGAVKLYSVSVDQDAGTYTLIFANGRNVTGAAEFDDSGLPVSVTDNEGASVTFSDGWPASASDSNGHAVSIVKG